jgi:UDP-glucose 4-epimerase
MNIGDNTMKVLVTGAAGYIGGHTALMLAEAGYKVIALDSMERAHKFPEHANIITVEGDIGNEELIKTILEEHHIGAVFNFAAYVSVPESEKFPEMYFENNATKAQMLMRAAANAGVPHFIQSSTAAVYGQPNMSKVDEDAPLEPINNYGRSKVIGEEHLKDVCQKSKMRYVALRYFNVVGCDPKGRVGYKLENNPSHLIRKALAVVMGRAPRIEIFGTSYPTKDGTCIRDYIHVVDLAQAHLAALEYLQKGGESKVYNCGYGHGYTVLEVIKMVETVTRKSTHYVVSAARAGDPAELIADSSRIRQELNWVPAHDDLPFMIADQLHWERSEQT